MRYPLLVCAFVTQGLLLVSPESASAVGFRHDVAPFSSIPGEAAYRDHAGNDAFAPVAMVSVIYEYNVPGFGTFESVRATGSGTLIDGRHLLTAAHVLDFASSSAFKRFEVEWKSPEGFTGPGFPQNTSAVALDSFIHPRYDGSPQGGGDIGLIRFDQEISGVTPATLHRGTVAQGSLAHFAGYGNRGDGVNGMVENSSGELRAGTNTIDIVGTPQSYHVPGLGTRNNPLKWMADDMAYIDFDDPALLGQPASASTFDNNRTGWHEPTDLEALLLPGDSGGGMFLVDPDTGEFTLAGVNVWRFNFGGRASDIYTTVNGATLVDPYLDWIDQITIPAPWSAPALALGFTLCCNRRRRPVN
jgi:hypothetical protein